MRKITFIAAVSLSAIFAVPSTAMPIAANGVACDQRLGPYRGEGRPRAWSRSWLGARSRPSSLGLEPWPEGRVERSPLSTGSLEEGLVLTILYRSDTSPVDEG
jgi:hypothetical protein